MPRKVAGTGRICRDCGVNDNTGVHVSARNLCVDCSELRQIAALVEISEGNGPAASKRFAGLRNYLDKYTGDSLAS